MERNYYSEYFELEDRHWWFVGRRVILLSVLDRYVGRDRALQLLDFGCGTGTMAQHLAGFGTVEALDADHEAVAFCRQRGVSRVTHLEGATVPFDDARFDVVTALDVLEHIEDDSTTLAELRRVLRPDGTLLCTVPAFPFLWGPQDEISHHFRRYVRSTSGDAWRTRASGCCGCPTSTPFSFRPSPRSGSRAELFPKSLISKATSGSGTARSTRRWHGCSPPRHR